MLVVIPDKRKKLEESIIACSKCGFPEVQISSACSSKTKTFVGFVHGIVVPLTVEEAVAMGWSETEMGMACPVCTGQLKYEEAKAAAEGAESGVGMGNMVNALAQNNAEALGEKAPEPISSEEILLPTVHILDCTSDLDAEGKRLNTGHAFCKRCHKEWSYKEIDGNLFTDPEYTSECIPAPSTEHLSAPTPK